MRATLALNGLMLIDSFKKSTKDSNSSVTRLVIAWSPGCSIVLMLISYNHFYVLIVLMLYVLLFQFLLIAISMVIQSMFLIKTSTLVFTIAADCLMSGNFYVKKLTCWHPKVVEVLTI